MARYVHLQKISDVDRKINGYLRSTSTSTYLNIIRKNFVNLRLQQPYHSGAGFRLTNNTKPIKYIYTGLIPISLWKDLNYS